jgi:hypothetical protein
MSATKLDPTSVESANLEPTKHDRERRRWLIAGVVFSILIVSAGFVVSVTTGEWLALLCATGLVIVPAAASRQRFNRSR